MNRSARLAPLVLGAVLSAAVFGLSAPVPAASAAPPEQSAPANAQAAPGQVWVQNFLATELWSGPDAGAVSFGPLRKFSFLRVERAAGNRYYVYNPRTNNFAFVDATAVGPSGTPSAEYLAATQVVQKLNVPARLVGNASIYADPAADDSVWLRAGSHNTPVTVEAQVKGDGTPWYRLDTGEYVAGDQLRLPGPTTAHYSGKWIDADLTEPTVVTAYEGDRAVASTLAIHGVSAWQTPVGTYQIWRRVANETMSSDGLGIPRNAPGGYYVENVLYTQYFSPDGAALHYNYWSSMWGYAGSHGCLGMNLDDSVWFWNWAEVGTPVVVHYCNPLDVTRWGFIADVHGNLPALQRAIGQLEARAVDHLVYLGDLLGRGDSDACVEMVRATATLSVVGNRDRDWAERVGPASREYVLALPILAEASDFVAVHGDPRLHSALNTGDPGRGLGRTYAWLGQHERRVAFWGHSHHARVWRKVEPDGPVEQLFGARVELPDCRATVYVVNVGTTGLPFPGKGPPCCALYDDRERWVELLALGAGRGKALELNF